MLLMDKGYYDYDYQAVKPKKKLTKEDTEIWSSEKLAAILNTAIAPAAKPKPKTAEELQAVLMSEIEEQKQQP